MHSQQNFKNEGDSKVLLKTLQNPSQTQGKSGVLLKLPAEDRNLLRYKEL
jgi:hypothetical protein